MSFNPLEAIESNDKNLFQHIQNGRSLAFDDGALSKKQKLLIAVALDAAHGAVNGVQSLALQAFEAGASTEELMEAIRVAGFISGAGAIYTAAAGLKDLSL